MFKENKQFWLYYVGIIILFFLLFAILKGGFTANSSLVFSTWPFNYLNGDNKIFPESEFQIDNKKAYTAVIKTSKGDITIQLFGENAPNTVSNFIYLANNHFYDGLKFHRYIKGLFLQGGSSNSTNSDPNDDKFGGPGYTIPDEINWDSLDFSEQLKTDLTLQGYKSSPKLKSQDIGIYKVAMATNGPNTGGSQFVIILADRSDSRVEQLRGKFTVFGYLTGGYALIDSLEENKLRDFFIRSVTIEVKEQ